MYFISYNDLKITRNTKCTPLVKVYIMEYIFKVLGIGGTNSWLEWMHQYNLPNLLLHSARLISTFLLGKPNQLLYFIE